MTENGNHTAQVIESEAVDQTAPAPPETTPNPARLYAKMAQVMGAVGRVEKRGKSTDSNGKEYRYVVDEDLYTACRDAMSAAGIAIIPRITHIEDSSKPVVVFIDFVLACTDTSATVTIPWIGKSYNAPDKAISSAVTMAEKYMLKSTFLIATGDPADDPDSPQNVQADEVTPDAQGVGQGPTKGSKAAPVQPARVASNVQPAQPRRQTVRPYTPAQTAKAK